ncbi:GGDEF domain-containing protein [Rubrivivax rivuli]|uniref:diguanylate cyclase n=1 Tax=Rubrivivax rivuli TaxID=1862385 RepID=A0A437RAF3_9BURK|nr:GGDEF domain-containing protein [Rubrivivax rivuli]RVU43749.1 GGDEF domain-containing protein [Rubrivivax rivuli]
MRPGLQGFFVRQPLWVSIPLIVALSVASSVGALFLLTELMGLPYGPSFRRSLTVAITAPVLVSAPIGGWIVHLLREVELARQQAQALAWNDELTALMNRRRFTEIGQRELALSQRAGRQLVAMLLDIDDFKRINDEHGHSGGDAVLQAMGVTLPRELRRTDLVARWGGEEFALMLPDTTLADAAVLAERVRKAVEQMDARLPGGRRLRCTVSIGLSEAAAADSFDTLIARADKAMYLAKAGGKNRVVVQAG